MEWAGKDPDNRTAFEIMDSNYGLLEMLEVKMASGRVFSEEFGADTAKIIFNQAV